MSDKINTNISKCPFCDYSKWDVDPVICQGDAGKKVFRVFCFRCHGQGPVQGNREYAIQDWNQRGGIGGSQEDFNRWEKENAAAEQTTLNNNIGRCQYQGRDVTI